MHLCVCVHMYVSVHACVLCVYQGGGGEPGPEAGFKPIQEFLMSEGQIHKED